MKIKAKEEDEEQKDNSDENMDKKEGDALTGNRRGRGGVRAMAETDV